jgi:hypothetical protein
MASSLLLYGADEFIGELVARQPMWAQPGAPDLVLAGRDDVGLAALAADTGHAVHAFDWRDTALLGAALANADMVLNAATPFEATMPAIVEAALNEGCHYLDLNTELDVERLFDLHGAKASANGLSLVCGAGPSAAVSGLMLNAALDQLVANGVLAANAELGAIRFAVSCVAGASRATAGSVWRALGRDVAVGEVIPSPFGGGLAVVWESRPIGQLERSFDFGQGGAAARHVCSGASLADLHVAGRVACRRGHAVAALEAYVASTTASRIGYPLGANWRTITAPAYSYDTVERLATQGFRLLPGGPPGEFREAEPFEIVLQIEDPLATLVLDWRLRGPHVYDMAAELATRMALTVMQGGAPVGLLAPQDLMVATMAPGNPINGFSGVTLDRRLN